MSFDDFTICAAGITPEQQAAGLSLSTGAPVSING
jgi:hypothetical protein